MDELIDLCNSGLGLLPARIVKPTYDRSGLVGGIVHIGVGNFHRAHQSWYLHRLLEMGLDHDWAIIGAGVRRFDAEQREKLLAQDCLTTLFELSPSRGSFELSPSGTLAEIVGSMIDYVEVAEGNAALIARMIDPAIRIVSLTVTEGGYYIDPVSGRFAVDHSDIVYDSVHVDRPRTAFGAIIAALRLRRERNAGPFTIQSCDNLRGNGDILRQTIVSLAGMSDFGLAGWIEESCSFPNSMVDCIVPATGVREMGLAESFGVRDRVPVAHENFRQWVMEDDFCCGRPQWEKVGVIFTDRVSDYEAMKLGVLNAGHQIVANAGEVLSIATISGCMEDGLIAGYLEKVQREEIIPHIGSVAEISVAEYVDLIARRFSNPSIVDTTRRVSFDGSSRHCGFVLPFIRACRAKGISVEGLALVEAVWCRMCAGEREDGSEIEPNDVSWEELRLVALTSRREPSLWLEQERYYGDLGKDRIFAASFSRWLLMIWGDGLLATLGVYISGRW